MVKIISYFITILATQLIAIIMWGEHVWLYKLVNGGVGSSPVGQIQPILWVTLVIEAISFILLTFYYKRKTEQ